MAPVKSAGDDEKVDDGGVIVRPLEEADLPTVAAFECEIARISFPDEPITDPGYHQNRLAKTFQQRGHYCRVIERAGAVVGWVWIAGRRNMATDEIYGDLRSYYVVPEMRRGPWALRLLRMALEYCEKQGYPRVAGRTAATNDAMRMVYRAMGFEERHVVYELVMDRKPRSFGD
ncbi:MAG: GNAT family N-acetyltransferase [Alphaproteobacteria bacterium]